MATADPHSDLAHLKHNVDSLVGSIHKTADVQVKLTTKLQWGSKTRPWRGLMDRYKSLLDNFEQLGPLIVDKSCKKFYDRIEKNQLKTVSDFLETFSNWFDQLEAVKQPSLQHVILFLAFEISIKNKIKLISSHW